ncbi:DUF2752 domain-containing protein [Halpernia frigidisoli]|uniref:DUF2752 domain-containing protein n=1 Tax=Halpernia frigidisoli TaxID=1125876 RepID=A0A1I3I4D2_9FLAO|nr:DUF2752 domain-containing protein [Halpernia frigidisoli]SFI42858.1 Protein of unknown function [Halpernia frigidisoli]
MWIRENKLLFLLIVLLLAFGFAFYYFVDPLSNNFIIKCPFKAVTGLDCPGCGSQRAIHELLHGNFRKAFSYNPLFIIALPYAFVGILFEWFSLKYKFPKTRKILFGKNAIYIVATVIIAFFILRNF